MCRGLLVIVALVLLPSCERGLWDYPFNRPRCRVLSPEKDAGYDDKPDASETSPDTSVLICGVRVPDRYDWQRDTAIGIGEGEIVLFRDMEEILSFPTGYSECASTDPDTQHLIDGHLYTEFSTKTSTYIRRDGEVIVEYEGRELLAGLLISEGDVYSLGCLRSGSGFTYRKNGRVEMERPGGIVFGSFQDSSYPRSGALYEDEGKICFAYADGNSSGIHIVEDGKERFLGSYGISPGCGDVKICGGCPYTAVIRTSGGVLFTSPSGTSTVAAMYRWTDCSIVDSVAGIFIVGSISGSNGPRTAIYNSVTGAVDVSFYEDVFVFRTDTGVMVSPASYNGYYCFSRACADFYGGDNYVVLSPEDGSFPVLRKNGEESLIKMNGFLTGVEVFVSPPS